MRTIVAEAAAPRQLRPARKIELVADNKVLRAGILSELSWLRHGFGTRACGLARPPSRYDHARVLMLHQIHSGLVWADPPPGQPGDGMLTQNRGPLLAIRTADCCPILIADVRRRVVAAVHAGWRGALARIAEKAVGEMRRQFGSHPADLRAALGPCIRACCYQVGNELRQHFNARFLYADELFQPAAEDPVQSRYPMLFLTGSPPGHPGHPRWDREPSLRFDLARALARQLADAEIPTTAIEVLAYCTACRGDLFFSHRRGDQGRMLSAIGKIA
jgi:YfiH family protein